MIFGKLGEFTLLDETALDVMLGNYDTAPRKIAVVLTEHDSGQQYNVLSVNTQHNVEKGEFVVAIHNNPKLDQIEKELLEKFFIDTTKRVDFGFVKDAPVWKLRPEFERMIPEPEPVTEMTPYGVVCRDHGKVPISKEEYDRQMSDADSRWACPDCGGTASFDEERLEAYYDAQEEERANDEELCEACKTVFHDSCAGLSSCRCCRNTMQKELEN